MTPPVDDRDVLVLSVRLVTGLHRELEVAARAPGVEGARAEAGLMVLRQVTRHLLDRLIATPPALPFRRRLAG